MCPRLAENPYRGKTDKMGLKISTNTAVLGALRNLDQNTRAAHKNRTQLSTGSRVSSASEDAPGMAISSTFNAYVRSNNQAVRNANDGLSMVQTSEQAIGEISNIVNRLRELAVQAASDTVGDSERGYIQKEVSELKSEIQRIADSTSYGTVKLLDGSGSSYDVHIGIGADEKTDWISYDTEGTNVTTEKLGLSDADLSSKEGARSALNSLDTALISVNSARATLGAMQSRFTTAVSVLGTSTESLAFAKSRIADTDIALASSELVRNNLLVQANVNTIAQATQMPTMALKLLS